MELVRGVKLLIDVIRHRLLDKATAKGVALGRQQILELSEDEFRRMRQDHADSGSETEVTEGVSSRPIGSAPDTHGRGSKKQL